MGFDRKTPKPKEPLTRNTYHKHEVWDKSKKKWVQHDCNCATGKNHRTEKSK